MRSSVIAIVLCLSAAAANAQAPVGTRVAQPARTGTELIKTSAGAHDASAADAQTPAAQGLPIDDGLPTLREAAPAEKPKAKQHRRAGPAMLLAAVAVMSGIALRRYSTRA